MRGGEGGELFVGLVGTVVVADFRDAAPQETAGVGRKRQRERGEKLNWAVQAAW